MVRQYVYSIKTRTRYRYRYRTRTHFAVPRRNVYAMIVITPSVSCIPENANTSVSLDVRLLADRTVPGPALLR